MVKVKVTGELTFGDKLYYIHPAKLNKIQSLSVTKTELTPKKGYIWVYYLLSSDTLSLLDGDPRVDKSLLDRLPTNKILVRDNVTSFITTTDPINVYFTSEKELWEWIKK